MNDDDRYSWKDRQRQARRGEDDFDAIRGILIAVAFVGSLALLALSVLRVLEPFLQ